jgi:hypothetical protein
MRTLAVSIAVAALCALIATRAIGTDNDRAAVERTALDYVEGWYEGDAQRMERALHPDLVARSITTDPITGKSRLVDLTAAMMVDLTRGGGGTKTPAGERGIRVQVLEVFRDVANVRVESANFVDFLHVVRWNGRWVIVNVLSEDR